MSLKKYNQKRDFRKTSEPKGSKKSNSKNLQFVVQKHDATNLHYDFRLELDGVLKSWAVPKGPSLNPKEKRLAMMVEDHPFDYKDFEGTIPEGNYGAGNVIVWDKGTYKSANNNGKSNDNKLIEEGLKKGDLKIILQGEKLKGEFALVDMKKPKQNAWLLIKKKDEYANSKNILSKDESVISGKKIDEIGKDESKKIKLADIFKKSDFKDVKKKDLPKNFKPMLATLTDEPFDDKNWIYEIKWDGYRAIAEIKDGKVNLHSRNNKSFNKKFSDVAEDLKIIEGDVILDGEVVVVDEEGKSSFQLLQNYQKTGKGNLVYYIFDIVYLNGYDLTELPQITRKKILQKIEFNTSHLKISDHIEKNGKEFFKAAQEKKLEGIIAKNKEATYDPGKRVKDWLKIKILKRQEAVIGGFTKPKGSRKKIGALVLGVYEGDDFIYVGHTGGGFTDNELESVYKKLKPLIRKTSPFKVEPKTNTPAKWTTPKIICEVKFSEWTDDGHMRQPIYLGLREDKDAAKVVKELPADVKNNSSSKSASSSKKKNKGKSKSSKNDGENKKVKVNDEELKLTHLSKIYFPEDGYTKGDVIEYYRKISKYILPYLKDRPENLNRHPNGINKKGFYQKDFNTKHPDWIKTEKIYSKHNESDINYLVCNDEKTLLYMANLGCIEINPWFSKINKIDNPDYMVIDLDPENISFDKVIETALEVKAVLDIAGAKSYCKTSGATGMHIYVPLNAKYEFENVKNFAKVIANIVHDRIPEFTSIERSPSKRQKKVYLDYLQNNKGQTIAAPYSLRPKPGGTVSTPLHWDEVKPGISPQDYNIENIFRRIGQVKDLFKGVLGKGIDIKNCLSKLEANL